MGFFYGIKVAIKEEKSEGIVDYHYKKYIPCLGINRGSSLFIGISYGADPNI